MKKKNGLDWAAVRRRIEEAERAMERSLNPSEEEKERVLRERAARLAAEPEAGAGRAVNIEAVEFTLAGELYAFESRHIKEICPLTELTPVPCTPPFVLGIINLRGRILSVIDMKTFFELPRKGLTDLNKVIVLCSETMEFGVLADSVLGTREIPLSEAQASMPTLTGIREEYLKGVTGSGTVILDAKRLLEDKDIVVHDNAEA